MDDTAKTERAIVELHRNSSNWAEMVEDMARMEKKIFPEHKSLARSFEGKLCNDNSGLFYSLIDDEAAGYVLYSWPSSLCASILELAVKEKYRRQGHGEALLKAVIEKCRSIRIHRISLHVDPSRTPALSLYKKVGFQVDTLLEKYYSSGQNAYRMYLDFT